MLDKTKTLAVGGTAAVVAGTLAFVMSRGADPPKARCYDQAVFQNHTEGAGFIQAVSADGHTVTFGATLSGGPLTRIVVRPPEGQKVKVAIDGDKANITFGQCEAGPSPEPSPSSSSTPPPSPPIAKCITFGDAQCFVDDPEGLMRAGDGRHARGSSGKDNTPGRVIEVTSPAGDTSPGTIRAAFAAINGPTKVKLARGLLDGKIIKFPVGVLLKWDKPYTTLDCSESSARFMPGDGKPKSQVITVGATHDVIFKGCGANGYFNEAKPQMPANDMSLFAISNFIGVPYPWDDEWATTPPLLRGTARRILFDQIGCSNGQDDCVAVYDGVIDTSVLRSFIRRGWHPTTAGSGDFRPPGDPKERRRITYAFNVWFRNGARQIRAWRGIRDWRFVRNIVAEWVEYVAPDVQPPHALKPISPNAGLWLEDDWGGENDLAYVKNNLGLPGADNRDSGCIVGGGPRCESAGSLPPGSPYEKCNPKMAATRWFFSGNEWGGSKDCHTNPTGYTGAMNRKAGEPPVPTLDELRAWSVVLAEVGPPMRLPDEQADLDRIAAGLPQ